MKKFEGLKKTAKGIVLGAAIGATLSSCVGDGDNQIKKDDFKFTTAKEKEKLDSMEQAGKDREKKVADLREEADKLEKERAQIRAEMTQRINEAKEILDGK